MNAHFATWRGPMATRLKALKTGFHPKQLIVEVAESLLAHYQAKPLMDAYGVYQHLMDYWAATLQDDAYLIAADGWQATTYRVIETKKGKDGKPGKQVDKGWACDLVPKPLIVARFYAQEQAALEKLNAELEATSAKLAELEEEHSGDDGAFSELDKVNKASVAARLKELQPAPSSFPRNGYPLPPLAGEGRMGASSRKLDARLRGHDESGEMDEAAVLEQWQTLATSEADLKKQLKDMEAALDAKAYAHYPKLTETEVKTLVVDDKWLATLDTAIHGEMDRVSQQLTQRVKQLAERYETPLPQMTNRVAELEAKVNRHLEKMGFAWS